MFFRKRSSANPIFQISIGPSVLLGTGACILFYGLLFAGPLDFALLRRYCLCHPVAIATSGLFFIVFVALGTKRIACLQQAQLLHKASEVLEDISMSFGDSHQFARGEEKSLFFETIWRSQSADIHNSWLGQRLTAILQRQLKRKNTKHLDQDIHGLAEKDADQQQDSYALVRIVTWAMPMLGFLGTVIGISNTLGHTEAMAIASGSQDAMNSLTAGLYAAFDSTALGLVLTMLTMVAQFAVNRSELTLLATIDDRVSEMLQLCLTEQEKQVDTSHVESALHQITQALMSSVQQIVQTQSELWQQTISAAHEHWQNLTTSSTELVQSSMTGAIESALTKHNESLQLHTEQLAKVQAEGAVLIDSRWQQWQTTLSEQARAVHQQQRAMKEQTELLNLLVEKHDAVRSMEMPLQATLERLTDVDRFHDAAICLTEAVAVLGTQMERYGYLGRQPVRRKSPEPSSQEIVNDSESDEPSILPLKRRAG